MFKNLFLYRIRPDWIADLSSAAEALGKTSFTPCGATQAISMGWVPPRGHAHGPLLESVGGQWLAQLAVQQRVLPGAVVKRRVEELVASIEKQTGRKPGKKERREIKDQAVQELLPQAFTRDAHIVVWIDGVKRLLAIDTASAARADDVLALLVKALDGFAVASIQTACSPAETMSDWLVSGEPAAAFSVDRECELKSTDESKAVVRYGRHPLDIDEVRQHIAQGKRPTRLAITWQGRVSLLLTETMYLRKLAFLDVTMEDRPHAPDADAAFDADVSLATGELGRLIPDLIDALGGEVEASNA